ncbi:hypothetical protein BD769DRAFT_1523806 [Suillus cothurnatus]|nr:hypothetical protein BD769DRAFT_1523806 [Suillus cothurnatus]
MTKSLVLAFLRVYQAILIVESESNTCFPSLPTTVVSRQYMKQRHGIISYLDSQVQPTSHELRMHNGAGMRQAKMQNWGLLGMMFGLQMTPWMSSYS